MPDDEKFLRDLREGKFDGADFNAIEQIIQAAGIGSESETGGITRATVQEALDVTSQPAPKKKSKRVAYSVSCILHLSGSEYQVQLLPPSSGYDKGYRLNKINAQKPTGYNIIRADGVIICECGDFVHRQEGSDSKGCKHIRGLVDMGMFDAPSVPERRGSGVFDG